LSYHYCLAGLDLVINYVPVSYHIYRPYRVSLSVWQNL
jgi:hypothetical protein